MVRTVKTGVASALLTAVLCTGAAAQSAATGGEIRHPPHQRLHKQASPGATNGSRQVWHDLIKGSAAQQELEQEDSRAASFKPVDHSRDEFGSDCHCR